MSAKDAATDPAPQGEAFLERWSRLKSEARRDERSAPVETGLEPGRDAAPSSDATDRKEPTVLPDLDMLGEDSDYSPFLAADVDPDLRRRALRKLFRSPKFNVCDGLDDYCDDFTSFTPLGAIITADMRFQLERAARKALAALEASDSHSEPATIQAGEAGDAVAMAAGTADPSDEDAVPEEKPNADDDAGTA